MAKKNRNRNLKFKPEDSENNFIGNRIKKSIFLRGYTQEEFANIIGTTKVSVSEWCNGIKLPQADKWPDIKIYLGIDITGLMIEYRRIIAMYTDFRKCNNIKEAKKMAALILSNASISQDNEIVDSVTWLVIALIGLNFSKFITLGYDEPDWYSVRDNMENYLDQDGELDAEFAELKEKLDSEDEEYDEEKSYFEDALYYWKMFSRAIRKGSTLHDRVVVAISKVIDTM